MLRTARESDKGVIKKLWQESFGDSDSYIDLYFNQKFDPDKTVLLEENGVVIGMAHLLPCALAPRKKSLYWYAVCIDKNMRGKGHFRFLVTKVLEETQKRGITNVCVPAPGLESVYQKLGFCNAFYGTDTIYYCEKGTKNSSEVQISKAIPEDFLFLFSEQGSTQWDLKALRYAFLENDYTGGQQIKIKMNNESFFAFAIKKEDHYFIDYHNISPDEWTKMKDSVFYFLNCEKIIIRFPKGDKIIGLCDSSIVNTDSRITMTLG